MHCQNCGAENDPDARFCAECGAPLESQISTQPMDLDEDDNDHTIVSVPAPSLESAESAADTTTTTTTTTTVDDASDDDDSDDNVDDDATEVVTDPEPEPPTEPEPVVTTPPADTPTGAQSNGDGLFTKRNIIIAIIVLVVLCCCCFALSVGAGIISGTFEDIQRELSINAPSLILG
jgi:hypothetical protein